MCAFGLGPPDDKTALYQHMTRVVFPMHLPLREALNRRCPGVSAQHRHVPLKGSRPGILVTRCTEAGVYCPQFVAIVCSVLQNTLEVMVGGVRLPKTVQPRETLRAGGFPLVEDAEAEAAENVDGAEAENADEGEVEIAEAAEAEIAEAAGAEDEIAEAAGGAEVEIAEAEIAEAAEGAEAERANGVDDAEVEEGSEATEEIKDEVGEVEGADVEDDATEEASTDNGPRNPPSVPSEGSSKWWTPTDFYSNLPYQIDGIWADEEPMMDENDSGQAGLCSVGDPSEDRESQQQAERQARAGVRAGTQGAADQWRPPAEGTDAWRISRDRTFVTVYHNLARRRMFVPSGIGFTMPPQDFRNERYTVCKQIGTGREVAFVDNWRERGEANPEIGFWTGRTVLVFQGKGLPWEIYNAEENEDDEDENDFGEEDPPEEEEEVTPSTMFQSPLASEFEEGRSRSRSRTRSSGGRREGHQEADEYVDLLSGMGEGPTSRELPVGESQECGRGSKVVVESPSGEGS